VLDLKWISWSTPAEEDAPVISHALQEA